MSYLKFWFTFWTLFFSTNALAGDALPLPLANSWWLQTNNPGSVFNSKKGFSHLKFNNKEELVIAVIDTGIDFSHPFLKEHRYSKNGKHMDFNFFTGTNKDSDLLDHKGHGTHITGIIIAAIKKINPNANVKLISLKIFPDPIPARQSMSEKAVKRKDPSLFGYYTKEASRYLIKLKKSGVNILAVNASWGGDSYDKDEFQAVKELLENDILLIAAAGNDGKTISKKGSKFYPASYSTELPGVLSVGNISKNGTLVKSSNFGAIVSILAPGEKILSTEPGGGYRTDTGTSMATPQVTAAVSLLKALYPEYSSLEIKNYLLKNSRFNVGYLYKTGSATRLDMNLLFRPKSQRYKFSSLKKLAKEFFVTSDARIKKNTACIKAPANKILCGTTIYDKILEVDGKPQSIRDISAKHNIESLKNSYYQLDQGSRIIESSLGSLIHSFSKNDKIYQRMLTTGFSFRDLYTNLGSGMLTRYYEGHVIIPVLSKREFLKYYPFSATKKEQKDRAYAKYITGLINSPPQFLDRIGPLYMQRGTPLTKVETQLVQSFPLPVTSYIAGFLSQRRTPDMVNVAKAMDPKDLNNKSLDKIRNNLLKMREMNPTISLSKSDIRYLQRLKLAETSLANSLASSLGAGSSLTSNLSPMEKSFKKETEKILAKPLAVTKVAGAKPIDKNQKSIPVVPVQVRNEFQVAEAFLSNAIARQRNKISKAVNGGSSSRTHFYTNYKRKGKMIVSKINPELRAKEIEEIVKEYNSITDRNVRDKIAKIEESNESILELRKLELEETPASKNTKESSLFAGNSKRNRPVNEIFKPNTGTRPPEPPMPPVDPNEPVSYQKYDPTKDFLCTPENYDQLFVKLDKLEKERTPHLKTILCEHPSKVPSIRQSSEVMKHFYYCKAQSSIKEKSFYELLANGVRASPCDPQEYVTACGDRMKNDIIGICNRIMPRKSQYKAGASVQIFLKNCLEEAKTAKGVSYQDINVGPELGEFFKKFKKEEHIDCKKISARTYKKPATFLNDFEKVKTHIKLSYKAEESYKLLKNRVKRAKDICQHLQRLLKEVRLDNSSKIMTSGTLKKFEDLTIDKTIRSENFSKNDLKIWLLKNHRLNNAERYIYTCSKKQSNSRGYNDNNSQ